jgi:hypothetical protein
LGQLVAFGSVGRSDTLVEQTSQYRFAPLTLDQLNVGVVETPVAPSAGPFNVGAERSDAGVWKYNTVVKDDSPAESPAATFHRYFLPAASVAL